jgi:hypothetical protein|tara:strand:- start:494 stop:991 length:498 start_codon:yes stop_codon:yes gene_type:complete
MRVSPAVPRKPVAKRDGGGGAPIGETDVHGLAQPVSNGTYGRLDGSPDTHTHTSHVSPFEKSQRATDGDPGFVSSSDDAQNDVAATVFVGGIDPSVTETDLRHKFDPCGHLVYVKIPKGKGCGFVQVRVGAFPNQEPPAIVPIITTVTYITTRLFAHTNYLYTQD